MYKKTLGIGISASIGIGVLFYVAANAQTSRRSPLIDRPVDESRRVTLHGNTRPEATAENDRGLVADDLALDHLYLQLKRSPEQEAAVRAFLDEQQDPNSPNYHQWLTVAEFGQRFGTSDADLAVVKQWLGSHGFVVNEVHPNGMLVDFSGTAGQVRKAFHTEIHNLEVNGTSHIANMSDPEIPEALAPVVEGPVSLHDFRPHPLNTRRADYSLRSDYTFSSNGTWETVVPGDLQTIYNFTPVYANYTGLGQTIVVIEDSNVYSTSDFTTFRSTFGLNSQFPSGSLTQVHPGTGCSNPGSNADDAESEIDVEWASAAAPNATIELASCSDTRTNFGGFIALTNLLATSNPPKIVSISYGEAETELGASLNAYINSLYQTAANAGVSLFVSSGDEGAASADAGYSSATHGITVSGYTSTIYNVSVGGTDFADSATGTVSNYWNTTNGTYYNSAKSYIPEIPWNDSCASQLISTALGFTTPYGSSGACAHESSYRLVVAGSGGPSNCATGAPSQRYVASGTCKGYAKPTWQNVTGNPYPGDGVRDIPDVSLFAANGVWGHYYIVCYSDPYNGGTPCTGKPSGWAGFGGTSVSSPIMAGIQALINQKKGAPQGNPNARLYALANSSYSTVFHDVTLGDMDVNCTSGDANCYDPGSARNGGVLSTSTSSYAPAYRTTTGWDFGTGLGSVNVANLVAAF